mmetsp:Transcript_75966/g.162988  ORF Transcript_75966/g.162988 Transcript_75966/m.162988 type:complete len:212 (-) Transcript_75966:8-643(-)
MEAARKPAPMKPPGMTMRVPPTHDFKMTRTVAMVDEVPCTRGGVSNSSEASESWRLVNQVRIRGSKALFRRELLTETEECSTADLPKCSLRNPPGCAMSEKQGTSGKGRSLLMSGRLATRGNALGSAPRASSTACLVSDFLKSRTASSLTVMPAPSAAGLRSSDDVRERGFQLPARPTRLSSIPLGLLGCIWTEGVAIDQAWARAGRVRLK